MVISITDPLQLPDHFRQVSDLEYARKHYPDMLILHYVRGKYQIIAITEVAK